MRITFFINEMSGGGAERVACSLANHLVENGNDVNILTLSDSIVKYYLDNRISVRPLINNQKCNRLFYFIKLYLSLRRYIKKNICDCYIVFLPVATCLLLSLRSLIEQPIIVSERSAPQYAYSRLMQKVLRFLCSRADAYVFQTEEVKEWYIDYLKTTRYEIIPNVINPEFLADKYKGKRRKCIVTAGRLDDVKNHELLIRAFSVFNKEHPDYTLEIYGEGKNKNALEDLALKLDERDQVILKGDTPHIAELIRDASLFVLSSNYEGMPNALIEAMALGLPCISTDCPVGGPRSLIENNINGVLVPVGDCIAMAKSMNKVIDNPSFATSLGERAAAICDKLGPEIIFEKWDQLIKQIVIIREY